MNTNSKTALKEPEQTVAQVQVQLYSQPALKEPEETEAQIQLYSQPALKEPEETEAQIQVQLFTTGRLVGFCGLCI